ncbi:MAG: DUF1552 domain-containing protein [Pseudohongiellaceae bacterium]|tara:strand:- start:22 stop:1365 length:1344 start_codon:yes stop_codon:yes gene_type:complete
MQSRTFSRRTILRGIGATVALPLLDAAPAFGQGRLLTNQNRLAYLYFPNGIPRGIWYPEKTGVNGELIQLNEWMSPLEPFKEEIIIPGNIWTPEGNGHVDGTPTWLTGHDYDSRGVNAGGVSADQIVARHLRDQTLLPSLELSTKGEGYFSNSLPRNAISWSAPDRPMTREIEPRTIFDRMFSTKSSVNSNRSVMDSVLADARSLSSVVSAADSLRLDEYFESIRALERRIEFAERQSTEMLNDRALTDTLVAPTPGIPADHESYVRLMMDLMILAFQSDATRVITFMLDHGQSNRYFNFIPEVDGTWHALSHYQNASGMTEDDDGTTSWESVEQKRAMYAEVVRWHHSQVAYLLGRMKNIREPDGNTLLDNSMILMGGAIGDGNEHDASHLPTLLAGRGGGTIKTGRYINHDEPTDLASIHVALMQRMGVPIERLGTAGSTYEGLI